MIGSTLIKQKSSSVVSIFIHRNRIVSGCMKGTCQHQGNVNNQTSTLLIVSQCQSVVGKRLQSRTIAFRWMKIEKVAFIQANRSFDLSGPIKLVNVRVFIYSKMERKINNSYKFIYQ